VDKFLCEPGKNKGTKGYMGVRVKARIVPSPGFFPKKSKKTEK
jgi:hypothetical protein